MTILGVSIGSRTTGIALMKKGELIDWRTHSFPEYCSETKVDRIVSRCERYVQNYPVNTVVMRVPPDTHQTPMILSILIKLVSLFQYHGCMVQINTKADLKRSVPEVTNKDTLMKYVITRYPILQTEFEQERANITPYHLRMFEAVLAADLCTNKTL